MNESVFENSMFTGVYKTKTEDQRPKTEDRENEDPNFFARMRHEQLKTKPKRSSAQTDVKITGIFVL